MAQLGMQVVVLMVLAIPVACVAWTVTHEEIFRETREYCIRCSQEKRNPLARKFFYLFTCEYCFSHYVAALFLWIAGYRLLLEGWRGTIIGFFALVWVSNQYMSVYNHLRLDIRRERVEIKDVEHEVKKKERAAESEQRDQPRAA